MIESNVVKGGEIIANAGFERSMKGLSVSIKTIPPVEEFIRSCGSGEIVDVRSLGHRYWNSIDGKPLTVYDLTTQALMGVLGGRHGYRLDIPGYSIVGRDEYFNLSILRLAGISEGAGVTFNVKGVFSEPAVVQMGNNFQLAVQAFYKEFMRPVGVYITVSMQQFSPGQIMNSSE